MGNDIHTASTFYHLVASDHSPPQLCDGILFHDTVRDLFHDMCVTAERKPASRTKPHLEKMAKMSYFCVFGWRDVICEKFCAVSTALKIISIRFLVLKISHVFCGTAGGGIHRIFGGRLLTKELMLECLVWPREELSHHFLLQIIVSRNATLPLSVNPFLFQVVLLQTQSKVVQRSVSDATDHFAYGDTFPPQSNRFPLSAVMISLV